MTRAKILRPSIIQKAIGVQRPAAILTLIVYLFVCCLAPQGAYAAEDCSEAKLRGLGVAIVNCSGDSGQCSTGAATAQPTATGDGAQTPTTTTGGSVYILGDSITVRTESKYRAALQAKSMTVVINGSVGRSWTGGGQSGSGNVTSEGSTKPAKDAVEDDAAKIQAASIVVVALGSNGGLEMNPIPTIVDTIRTKNATASIWWVNTAGTSAWTSANLAYLGPFNASLTQNASAKNFRIIDWFKAVNPAGDPNTSPTTDTSGLLADGLHPNDTGTTKLSELVSNAISGSGAPTTASGCCAAGGSTTLAGSDNPSKVWNYFISKGFTNLQAAGAMGNLQHEGNFNPKIVEGGTWGGQDWPPEMETIPPAVGPAGQPGYGIVQWTSAGRKGGLQQLADQTSRPVYDLGLQLDFMWQELNSSYYKTRALDPLMAATDLETAVKAWQNHYEVGANFEPRMQAATEWLERMGSGGTPTSPETTPATTASSCSSGGATSGIVGGTRYPLMRTKEQVKSDLGSCYDEAAKKICDAGHPYRAHDLFAPQGTQVVAYAPGEVISAHNGSCGHGFGDAFTVQVYNQEANTVFFYQHMDPTAGGVAEGTIVKTGDPIGKVGPSSAACNTQPHLHFDATTGNRRPGCSRLNCPAENQAKFQDISSQLFIAAEALQ